MTHGTRDARDDEIRSIVRTVLEEERAARTEIAEDAVLKAVVTILTSFGIEEEDRLELRRDFRHLRSWRRSVEQAQSITFRIVVTTIVTGLVGAVWLGFKAVLALRS
jgi:hypothetical protein